VLPHAAEVLQIFPGMGWGLAIAPDFTSICFGKWWRAVKTALPMLVFARQQKLAALQSALMSHNRL